MSSGLAADPYAATNFINSDLGDRAGREGEGAPTGKAFALSPRQLELDHLWRYYKCTNYDNRKVDWNGGQVVDHLEHEVIATQGYTPAGFYDAGASFPVKFRKPSSPYYLAKIIVDRFTGLLFAEGRQPTIKYAGDPLTEDYMRAVAEVGRLWPAMMLARKYGGAMGSVAVGFSLVVGVPRFEVHDPRWCIPTFKDRHLLILEKLEKRYVYPDYLRSPEGDWYQAWFWYRRVISEQTDEVWSRVPVEDGEEPNWSKWESKKVYHALGRCPVVWIQNTAEEDDIDGDPDCHGAYDMIESHDALFSQAQRALLANCDPTLFLSSDEELDGPIVRGSDNVLKLEMGASAQYLEISGSGPEASTSMADKLRDRAYEMTACVPDELAETPQTATEVRTRMARMLEKADQLREQYGEMGVKRLLELAEFVIKKVLEERTVPFTDDDGEEGLQRLKGEVRLPPKYVELDMGDGEDPVSVEEPRVLGRGGVLSLQWPRYFEPTLNDVQSAVMSTTQAVQAQVIDLKTAIAFLKNYLPVEDDTALIRELEKAQEDQWASVQEEMGEALGEEGEAPAGEEPVAPEDEDDEFFDPDEPFDDSAEDVPDDEGAEEDDEEEVPGAAEPQAPAEDNIQHQALNGAQVTSLVTVVEKAAAGEIPRESAMAIIRIAFQLTRAEAEEVLGAIGKGFEAKNTEEQPSAPEASPPPAPEGP